MESGYAYNSSNRTLEHYSQESPDYDKSTYQAKEVLLEGLSDCRFSYWDGQIWQVAWDESSQQLPQMVRINFKFIDETKEQEFLMRIPVSP